MSKLRGRGGRMILKGHARQVSTFTRDGDTLASVDWHGDLHLWKLWQPKSLRQIKAHTDRAQGVLLGEDWVATCGWDRHIRLWRRDDLSLIAEISVPERGNWFVRFWGLRMSPDGTAMEATLQDGRRSQILRFPLKDGVPDLTKKTTRKTASTVTHHPTGTLKATTSPAFVLACSDHSGTERWRIEAGEGVRAWSMCDRGEWLLLWRQSPRGGSSLEVIDAATGQHRQRIDLGDVNNVGSLKLTADHRMLLGHVGTRVCAWETATGKALLREDWRHTDHVSKMELTADGTLITSGWDRTLRLWDLSAVIAGLADAPTAALPLPPTPADRALPANAEAAAPEGVTDPDVLRAQGYYRAAISAYQATPLEDAPDRKTGRAWRMLDVASCLLKLGEAEEARLLHCKAKRLVSSSNLFNAYAWALLEAGEHDRAVFLSEASFTVPDSCMREINRHAIHTWLSILDAQGRTGALIPQLAARWLMVPDHRDWQALFERHRAAVDAFLDRSPTAAEQALLVTFFDWMGDDWSARADFARKMIQRDPTTWLPLVQTAVEEARLYWTANPLVSVLIEAELASGRAALRARISLWIDESIKNRGKVALRELVLSTFDSGPAPGVFRKLTRAAGPYPRFGDAFLNQLTLPEPLRGRVQYLCAALDANSLNQHWGYDVRYRSGLWSDKLKQIVRFSDGVAATLDMLGRVNHRQEYAVEALAELLQAHRSAVLAGIPQAGPKSQVWLLAELAGKLTPAEERALMTTLCTASSKPVRAAAAAALKADPLSADGMLPLLKSKRKADRLTAVTVLTHHNRSQDAAALTAMLTVEKDAGVRALLEAWKAG